MDTYDITVRWNFRVNPNAVFWLLVNKVARVNLFNIGSSRSFYISLRNPIKGKWKRNTVSYYLYSRCPNQTWGIVANRIYKTDGLFRNKVTFQRLMSFGFDLDL